MLFRSRLPSRASPLPQGEVSVVANREIRHVLQSLDQRRVIPVAAADGRAGAEHLLGVGGVGQVDVQLLGALQGQVQVLLVQADAEARIEGALDHALAVYFQDLRGGKTTHQSFANLGWIGNWRSEEHTSELQSLMRISYAVFCLKKKKKSEIPSQLHISYT